MLQRKMPAYAKALLLTVVLFLTACAYGRLNFYRDPGSIFYDQSRAFERRYSIKREQEASTFFRDTALQLLDQRQDASIPAQKSGSAPKICAVFVTVGRENSPRHPLQVSVLHAGPFRYANDLL